MRVSAPRQTTLPQLPPWRPEFVPPNAHVVEGVRNLAVTAQVINWLPLLVLTMAVGLLQVSLANTAARANWPYAEALWWLGLGAIYAPTAVNLLRTNVSRNNRLLLVVLLGMALYGVKLVNTPLHPAYHDEFAHLRVAVDIFNNQTLFSYAPQLPVTPLYPGMGIATVALARLSGLPLYLSGLILLGSARLVMMFALFMLFERISGSSRVAGIAALIYVCNPNYLLFDAQYSYESLALPLALMAISMLVRRMVTGSLNRFGFNVAAMVLVAAIAVTHHLTAYMTIMFLGLWTFTGGIQALFRQKHQRATTLPVWVFVFALFINAIWLLFVANFTLRYLTFIFGSAFDGVVNLVQGGEIKRLPFQAAEGSTAAPLVERLLGLGSAGLIVLLLPFGLIEIWRKHREKVTALTLALAACLHPAMLLLRLTGGGWEISNRSSEFLFVGIGLLLALALVNLKLPKWMTLARARLAMPILLVLFFGGIMIGWSPWMRLKWPYMVVADYRSIEPQGIQAAYWMRDTLGRYNVVASDRINNMLMAGLGEQNTVSGNGFTTAGIFLQARLGQSELDVIRKAKINYLVVDKRLSTGFPKYGYYFQSWERNIWPYYSPVQQNVLEKWDYGTNINKVFDSGDLRIYDIGALQNAAQ